MHYVLYLVYLCELLTIDEHSFPYWINNFQLRTLGPIVL
jgi:hypothetical protein